MAAAAAAAAVSLPALAAAEEALAVTAAANGAEAAVALLPVGRSRGGDFTRNIEDILRSVLSERGASSGPNEPEDGIGGFCDNVLASAPICIAPKPPTVGSTCTAVKCCACT